MNDQKLFPNFDNNKNRKNFYIQIINYKEKLHRFREFKSLINNSHITFLRFYNIIE